MALDKVLLQGPRRGLFLMSEVTLYPSSGDGVEFVPQNVHGRTCEPTRHSQGYLAHKKHPPPGTLEWDYIQGPRVALRGWLLLMTEVPL